MSKTYLDKLKDPRWQKKRLQVMERDKFSCMSCGDEAASLNVHHRVPYRKDADPWDYDLEELITLCEDCHKSITDDVNKMKALIIEQCRATDYSREYLRVLKALKGLNPYQLLTAWQLIQVGVNGGLFQCDTYNNYV